MSEHDWFTHFDRNVCAGRHPDFDAECPEKEGGLIDRCGVCGCTLWGLDMSNSPPSDCVRRQAHRVATDGGGVGPFTSEFDLEDAYDRLDAFEEDVEELIDETRTLEIEVEAADLDDSERESIQTQLKSFRQSNEATAAVVESVRSIVEQLPPGLEETVVVLWDEFALAEFRRQVRVKTNQVQMARCDLQTGRLEDSGGT